MRLRQAEPRMMNYAIHLSQIHTDLCVFCHMKTQGCLLYLRPNYVKTEEIAERKGVIFLHLKEHVCVHV